MKSEKLEVVRESRNVFRDLRHEIFSAIGLETGAARSLWGWAHRQTL